MSFSRHLEKICFAEFRSKEFLKEDNHPSVSKNPDTNSYLYFPAFPPYIPKTKIGFRIIEINFESLEHPVLKEIHLSDVQERAAELRRFQVYSTMEIFSLPLYSVVLPEMDLEIDSLEFRFMDVSEEKFTLLEKEETMDSFTEENTSKTNWRVKKNEPSPLPRARPNVVFIAEEDVFLIFGGLVSGKFLPDDYVRYWCKKIMRERNALGRKNAHQLLMNSYYLTNDIWKYHIKQGRWEMILPPTPLIKLEDPVSFYRSSGRPILINSITLHCPKLKKIYHLTPKQSSFIDHVEFHEYDYLKNCFEKVDELEKPLENVHLGNSTSACIDNSNETMIFLSKSFDKLIVVCLRTYKTMEIPLETNLTEKSLRFLWKVFSIEKGRKLVFIALKNSSFENECETIVDTFKFGVVDWERVKTENKHFFQRME